MPLWRCIGAHHDGVFVTTAGHNFDLFLIVTVISLTMVLHTQISFSVHFERQPHSNQLARYPPSVFGTWMCSFEHHKDRWNFNWKRFKTLR
jgi:hypothetical protein